LQFASIAFDASAEEIYPTLTRGATLILRSNEMLESSEAFWQNSRDLELTVLDLPTAYWHHLVRDLPNLGVLFPETLRLVIIGGEMAMADPLQTWFRYAPRSVRLTNSYGPTEATVVATVYEAKEQSGFHNVPIGRPIGNIRAYVLDKRMYPVPLEVPGELYIGGEGLARGYLNNPDLSAERFAPDPFGPVAGARLYRTGDFARYLADGNIEFLSRTDNQVKIRGYRIELGEVEMILNQHPAIEQAVVTAQGDGLSSNRLVAYVVSRKERSPFVSELQSFLREKLPDFMVPSAVIFLDSLQLTPSGKIDRRALPEPNSIRPHLQNSYVAPGTSTEKQVAKIWRNLLKLDEVGIHDNFFDLGGHSLLAIQVVARINDEFRIELPLRTLFEQPTVNRLAEQIEIKSKTFAREDMLALLADLESLSDEEAQTLMQKRDSPQLKND
jgi:acyl-coenzyme A synthetase/AMP-(fatty) acid ligase/acyl carrier protein